MTEKNEVTTDQVLVVVKHNTANTETLLEVCTLLRDYIMTVDVRVSELEKAVSGLTSEVDQLKDQVHELNNKVFEDK